MEFVWLDRGRHMPVHPAFLSIAISLLLPPLHIPCFCLPLLPRSLLVCSPLPRRHFLFSMAPFLFSFPFWFPPGLSGIATLLFSWPLCSPLVHLPFLHPSSQSLLPSGLRLQSSYHWIDNKKRTKQNNKSIVLLSSSGHTQSLLPLVTSVSSTFWYLFSFSIFNHPFP